MVTAGWDWVRYWEEKAMVMFSVIIPTYNRCDFLKSAVDSVLNQTCDDYELIIIDDGSCDGTRELINSYNDPKIKYFYQEKKGPAAARNRGISESQGEYIAFLDSDDRWVSKKLEEVLKAIKNNPDYYIFHTQEKWHRNGCHLNHMKKHMKQYGDVFKNCLEICSVSVSTAVVKKEVFYDIGTFDEKLNVCEDYDFWLRVSVKYPVYLVDKILTLKEGGHTDQLSSKYYGMDRFRIKSIIKLLDSGVLNEDKYSTAFLELKKKCSIYANGCFKRDKNEEGKGYMELINKYNPEN